MEAHAYIATWQVGYVLFSGCSKSINDGYRGQPPFYIFFWVTIPKCLEISWSDFRRN